jgi:hypothetical protein
LVNFGGKNCQNNFIKTFPKRKNIFEEWGIKVIEAICEKRSKINKVIA